MSLLSDTDGCMLEKLSKNFDECENHPEYDKRSRQQNLDEHYSKVMSALKTLDLRLDIAASNKALAAVYLLYKELLTDGPWGDKNYKEYSVRLDQALALRYGVTIGDLLKTDHAFDRQGIFNEMMHRLNLKLTAKDFKRFPSLLKVYCSIFMNEIEEYTVRPTAVMLPVSLYLIDDYNFEHKKSGLTCCVNILNKLEAAAFAEGNYYEIVYGTLKKTLTEKDNDITKLTTTAICELIRITKNHADFCGAVCEELLDIVLEQIQMESKLHRRAVLFAFLTHIISWMGVNCINRQIIQHIFRDNLEISCQPGIEDIILLPVIEVLEAWIRHCWCAWNNKTGVSIIASLMKVLCICKNNDLALRIINILAAIYHFSSQDEKERFRYNQQQIVTYLENKHDNNKIKRMSTLHQYMVETNTINA